MTLIVKGKLPNILKNNRRLMKILPRKIAVLSLNHYLKGFDKGGKQTNDSLSGWKARKKETKKTRGRALLVQSGDFKRSLSILLVNKSMIKLGTNGIPYASFHNEGSKGLPKREVLGESKILDYNIKKLAIAEARKQNRK